MTGPGLLEAVLCGGIRGPLAVDRRPPKIWAPSVQVSPSPSRSFDKTLALFQGRLVLSLARMHLDPDAFAEWFRHACSVQQAIYDIDHYYERSACIEIGLEAPLWSDVERHLRMGTATPGMTVWSAFQDLRRYADAERRLHALDVIDPREFERLLLLKCSDVRIARALIWSYGGHMPVPSECHFWSVYDQCWELIEDLQDLHEDGRDWNFNFWLYSFMAGQSAEEGIGAATELLKRKVSELQAAYCRLPSASVYRYRGSLDATVLAANTAAHQHGLVLAFIAAGRAIRFADRLRFSTAALGSKSWDGGCPVGDASENTSAGARSCKSQ